MRFAQPLAAALLGLGLVHAAQAAFVTPDQWTRPANDAEAIAAQTTFQEWNVFLSPAGPNDPDVADVNPNAGNANLVDTSGASFLTGGGNIYSPTAALNLDADIPSYGLGADYRTTVLFQLRSLGSEVNYDTVRLTYNDAGDTTRTVNPISRQELARLQLGGFGGSQVDTLFLFDVPFSPPSFRIEFDAAGSSLSVDAVAVDTLTSAVPEPGMGLLGLGAATLLARSRRRPL